MSTVALVPAYRRADRVGDTVRGLRPLVDRVVVIDDGSGDGGATVEAARRAGATVVALAANRGKGGALAAGIAATPGASTYLLVDADTAGTAAATAPLLAAVRGGADLAIGVLPPAGGRGGFGTVRTLAAWGIRRACGFEAAAPLSGQRAVSAALLRSLEPADRFGVEVAMTIDAVRAGAQVVEVPVDVDHAHTGRGVAGFSHRAAQGWDLLRALWPRLLAERRRGQVLVGTALVAVCVLTLGAMVSLPGGDPLGPVTRVVLVAAPPALRLEDLDDPSRPELAALAGARGAVAAANVDVPGRTPESTWATVGAGAKVRARPPTREPDPLQPFLVQDLEEGQGRLGDALRRAGRPTAFVGTSPTSPVRLAVADSAGRIDRAATAGSLGAGGLVNRTRADLTAGAALVAVDASELDPAGLEDLLAGLRDAGSNRPLMLVVTPAAPGRGFGLRPLLASGPGAPAGRLVSPSTRRDGFLVLSDLAPTILDALDVPRPEGMVGRPLQRLGRDPDLAGLVEADRQARQRNTVWDPALLVVVPLHAVAYAWAWRKRRHIQDGEEQDEGTKPAWAPPGAAAGAAPDDDRSGAHRSRDVDALQIGVPGAGRAVVQPADAGVDESRDADGVGEGGSVPESPIRGQLHDAERRALRPPAEAGAAAGGDPGLPADPARALVGDGVGAPARSGRTDQAPPGQPDRLSPLSGSDDVEAAGHDADRGSKPGAWPLAPAEDTAVVDAGHRLPRRPEPLHATGGRVAGGGDGRPRSRALAQLGLALVAWPLATWLVRAVPGSASLGRWAGLLALAIDALVVAVAWRAGHRRGLAPLAIVLGATIALVTIDLGLGGPLQVSSALGNAAHTAGRFSGLGNTAFAVYAACALMAVACGRRRAPWMVALLVLVALVDALPPLGADVGGALVLAPTFALTVAALWDRLSWRAVALAGCTVAVLLGLALAVDLSRSTATRSHLARFVTGEGRGSSVGGKLSQNLGTYAAIPVLVAVVAVTAALALLLWRGRFRSALPFRSPARIGVAAALAVALIGNLVNDSGPIVTMLAMSILAPALVVRSAMTEPPPEILTPLDGSSPA